MEQKGKSEFTEITIKLIKLSLQLSYFKCLLTLGEEVLQVSQHTERKK